MTKTIDIEDIKQKLFKKLEPSGWNKILKSFIFSDDFDNILKQLILLSKDGKRFTPKLSQLFKAFEECPYNKLKIVIIGQDPYPELGVADGIAFSCSNTMEQHSQLRYLLNAVNRTVYDGVGQSHNPDLSRWSNQGILMLNTALTTTVSKTGQHYPIWKPFLAYLFDHLSFAHTGLIYVYIGKQAQDWKDLIHDMNYKFSISHPASTAYLDNSEWDCANIFNNINNIMYNLYGEKIIW
jgi:uracil-DNA glycosylase